MKKIVENFLFHVNFMQKHQKKAEIWENTRKNYEYEE